jgi:ATP-dependent helicase/nuclease subunit A
MADVKKIATRDSYGNTLKELAAEGHDDLVVLDADLAEKLDLARVQPFFESGVWRRIRTARRVLREEPFITALPASQITPEAEKTDAEVLVQGIADLVLVFDDHAEICDYKTDASKDPDFYKKEYAAQLRLYRHAFALRLDVPVTKLTIYSFTLQQEIDIPLREG